MRVRFWGVRGSVPWSSDQSSVTGSNTPCVQLSDGPGGAALILDAGTGLVGLGERGAQGPGPLTILLSHYHWDHVQGLPFFNPCFRQGQEIAVFGPALDAVGPDWLAAVFAQPHFPLQLEALPAALAVTLVETGSFRAGGFDVEAIRLNHPGGSFAYRIKGTSGDFVYATDHEFGNPDHDERLAAFAAGAAAIVLDAHYTPGEWPAMAGRGHGSWRHCVDIAAAAGVDRVWLFHHKPGRTDAEIAELERAARDAWPGTTAAREGHEFTI